MQDRLPSAYTRALKYPLRNPLRGFDLYTAILDASISFNLNYEMVFPDVSDVLVLLQYTKRLALPGMFAILKREHHANLSTVDVLITSRSIVKAMHISCSIPIKKSRVFILDHPEILLMAVTIVAAKLSFPFQSYQSLVHAVNTNHNQKFKWNKWQRYMKEHGDALRLSDDESNFDQITVDDVARMTPQELDAYFAHIASSIDRRSGLIPEASIPAY